MSDQFPGFVCVEDYLRLPRDPATWLIEPLIPIGGAAILYGQEKSGKSAIAIQLAAALSGGSGDWMGFPVRRTGPVLYLQLDNPRSTWAQRFEILKAGGLSYTSNLFLADRGSIEKFPFDILQPSHMEYLKLLCAMRKPIAVFVDTLRELHSGDENESTTARNVIAGLVGAVGDSALVLISHARKPQPDSDRDLMADHRGSSYITGRMDAILRMTHNRLYYGGRSIEQGNLKLERMELDGALLFAPAHDEAAPAIAKILADTSLTTLRAKARALAPMISSTEEAAMSKLRRMLTAKDALDGGKAVNTPLHLVG